MMDERNGVPTPEEQAPAPTDEAKPLRFSITLKPYAIDIDGGGLSLNLLEDGLLRALAFVQRELLAKRLADEDKRVQLVRGLPRMNP